MRRGKTRTLGAMPDEIAEVLYDDTRSRRVVIFRRPSGVYGYCEERYYKNDLAQTEGWAFLWEGKSSYDTLDTARREVADHVHWLPKHRTDE